MEGSKVIHYPKEITNYYELHKDSGFFNEDMILCGDFNCDVRLNDKRHGRNVYEMMDKLSEIGLVDAYHNLTDEKLVVNEYFDFYKILENSTSIKIVDQIDRDSKIAVLGAPESMPPRYKLSRIITSSMRDNSDIIYIYTYSDKEGE